MSQLTKGWDTRDNNNKSLDQEPVESDVGRARGAGSVSASEVRGGFREFVPSDAVREYGEPEPSDQKVAGSRNTFDANSVAAPHFGAPAIVNKEMAMDDSVDDNRHTRLSPGDVGAVNDRQTSEKAEAAANHGQRANDLRDERRPFHDAIVANDSQASSIHGDPDDLEISTENVRIPRIRESHESTGMIVFDSGYRFIVDDQRAALEQDMKTTAGAREKRSRLYGELYNQCQVYERLDEGQSAGQIDAVKIAQIRKLSQAYADFARSLKELELDYLDVVTANLLRTVDQIVNENTAASV